MILKKSLTDNHIVFYTKIFITNFPLNMCYDNYLKCEYYTMIKPTEIKHWHCLNFFGIAFKMLQKDYLLILNLN